MVGLALGEVVRFEGFQFDRACGNLVRENASDIAEPLTLGSRATALLGLLLDRQGNLVTKDEIFAAVWPGTTVEEANLTVQIAVALDLELIGVEAARPAEHPDALDYILRGRAANLKPPSRDSRAEAISMFERALALDPRSVAAHSLLATALMARLLDNLSDAAATDITRAEELVGQALAASPRNPLAHYAKGQVLRAQNRYEEAIPEYETAIAFNRNWVRAIAILGLCKFYTGSIEAMIPAQEQAIRLSPRDPVIGTFYYRIGIVHLLQSRTDKAILWLEKARNANPVHPLPHAPLASAYALNSETERAAAELAEARRLSGDNRFSSLARLKAVEYWGVSSVRALFETTYFAGLRKAGMAEE